MEMSHQVVGNACTRSRQRWIQQNKLNIILYITGLAFVLFVYHVFSDGDFSFLLTLGAMVRMFGFVLLLIKYGIQRNCSGISLKTLELYALVYAARLSSILVYEGTSCRRDYALNVWSNCIF